MTSRFNNICIVTGASRGIGAATARLAARNGFAVVVNFRSNEVAAQGVVNAIVADGGHAVAMAADIADPAQIRDLFARTRAELGVPTALVNNAFTQPLRQPVDAITPDEVQRILAVGLAGPILCISEAARHMSIKAGGKGGAIVNVSSQAAVTGGRQLSAYVGAKGGLNAITAGLARELGPLGIRINTVSPGVIETDQQPLGDPAWLAEAVRTVPLGRLGRPEDVAKAICWLLSADADYVSGAILAVTGGR